MTITAKQAARMRKLIKELCAAERADEMRGAQNLSDWPEIDENLRVARKRVKEHIDTLRLSDGKVWP